MAQKLEAEKLRAYIAKHLDRYLSEIAKEFGITVTAVFYACKRLNIKKKMLLYKEKDEEKRKAFLEKSKHIPEGKF